MLPTQFNYVRMENLNKFYAQLVKELQEQVKTLKEEKENLREENWNLFKELSEYKDADKEWEY